MNRQTIMLIVLVIVFGISGFLWYRYLRTRAPATETTAETRAAAEGLLDLTELRRLKTLQLDTSVLRDPFFRSLELPSVTPAPEITPGNPNPFLPKTP